MQPNFEKPYVRGLVDKAKMGLKTEKLGLTNSLCSTHGSLLGARSDVAQARLDVLGTLGCLVQADLGMVTALLLGGTGVAHGCGERSNATTTLPNMVG